MTVLCKILESMPIMITKLGIYIFLCTMTVPGVVGLGSSVNISLMDDELLLIS